MAILLEGKPAAAEKRALLNEKAARLKKAGISCGLAVVLVGDDPASIVYSEWLGRLCGSVGLPFYLNALSADSTEEEVLSAICCLNKKTEVAGILPMMPLPRQLDARVIASSLYPDKDVDAMHPLNIGLLAAGRSIWAPCTPRAVMTVLDYYKIPLAGKRVVIIGRSNVVGKPLFQLMLARDATVTVAHSRTDSLSAVVREADLVVAAVGKPHMITADMIKPGAVVVDVGINEVEGNIIGDVDFAAVESIASAITPVPGGIGTVSTVMVLESLLRHYE